MIKAKGNIKDAITFIEHCNQTTNAIAFQYKDAAFGDGILNHATITVKDIFATKDAITRASSKILDKFSPNYDATIIKKLRAAGAAIIAKTNMDELALGGDGLNSAYGKIFNKLDKNHLVGGSSSGSAASFGEQISIAIGSDTGDSIRIPASYNRIFAFKPSYGAVSRFGMMPFASSLDTVGWFSHNVNDAILTSIALYGEDELDMTSRNVELPNNLLIKPKKVAILNTYNGFHPSINKELHNLKSLIEKQGIVVDIVSVSKDILEAISPVYDIISFSETSSNNSNLTGLLFGQREYKNNWEETVKFSRTKYLGSLAQKRFILGGYYLHNENQEKLFLYAQKVRRVIADEFTKIHDSYDVLLAPCADIAPRVKDGKKTDWTTSFLAYSNMEGSPAFSMPWASHDNLPFNLHISAKIYNDKKLLSICLYFEKLLGGNNE